MNDLPSSIEALEYEETCGNRHIADGILMIDDEGNEICRLTNGTIREKKIALLWAAAPKIYDWATEAAQETRAFYDKHDDLSPPSWLAELEDALGQVKY